MTCPNFEFCESFGEHSIYKYNQAQFPFRTFFESLYKTSDLEHLHLKSSADLSSNLQDIETDLHKLFYCEIKTNPYFKQLYCQFIKSIYQQFFPSETFMIFQSFPSVRFQFINNKTIPPHYDSDSIGKHPVGEKNFLIPITSMFGTKRLFIESSPKKCDFKGITMSEGEILFFNGNTCTHYNETNSESTIRISLDFRIILKQDYIKYINSGEITQTNPRDPEKQRTPTKMIIGGYYQSSKQSDSIETMTDWHFQKDLILQSKPNFSIEEANACFEYLKDGKNFITEYEQTANLETIISNFIGVKHVLMTPSGSMALILALLGCNIKQGDDVIVPDYTMIATINAVKLIGANPVIVDVNTSGVITKEIIVNNRTVNTKCVLFVSLNNRQYDILEIQKYCKQTDLLLIEDSAQSLGSFVDNQHFGTFGDIGCFSLSTPKIISTGQGGFVVTNNTELFHKMKMIKNFGRQKSGEDKFQLFGLNLKFTDLQAVIGIEQMKKLPNRINFMKELYNQYYSNLSHIMIKPNDTNYLPWFIDIYLNNRDNLSLFLNHHNIQTRYTYPSIHTTPIYSDSITSDTSDANDSKFQNSLYISNNGLFLPSHTCLTKKEVSYICNLIQLFLY